MMTKIFNFSILIVICLLFAATIISAQDKSPVKTNPPKTTSTEKKEESNSTAKPAAVDKSEPFDKADVKTMAAQCVTLETEKGNIELEMFPDKAPETVRNFLNLAAGGFLDSTTFSRVVPGFIIQGGDLGTGGKWTNEIAQRARKTIPDEPNSIKHERGIISMARPDEPNSATTHFFILLRAADTLDEKFAAFGRVRNGMETVETINKLPVEDEKPVNPVKINKAKVAVCTAQTATEVK